MSKEKLSKPEHKEPKRETTGNHEQLKSIHESLKAKAESESKNSSEKVRDARQKIEKTKPKSSENQPNEPISINSQIFTPVDKEKTYTETMKSVQAKLSSRQKTFSKVIHSPVVEKISDGAAKTVGRPSIMAGGFTMTFIASVVVYLIARDQGYSINTFSFLVLVFLFGAGLGLLVELIQFLIKQKRN